MLRRKYERKVRVLSAGQSDGTTQQAMAQMLQLGGLSVPQAHAWANAQTNGLISTILPTQAQVD